MGRRGSDFSKRAGRFPNRRSFGPAHIQLDILPLLMAGRFGLPNNVMGLAPGTGSDRRLVYVFYSSVEALARRQSRAHLSTAVILGHAMAHEIGHLLLNQESHNGGGRKSVGDIGQTRVSSELQQPPSGQDWPRCVDWKDGAARTRPKVVSSARQSPFSLNRSRG